MLRDDLASTERLTRQRVESCGKYSFPHLHGTLSGRSQGQWVWCFGRSRGTRLSRSSVFRYFERVRTEAGRKDLMSTISDTSAPTTFTWVWVFPRELWRPSSAIVMEGDSLKPSTATVRLVQWSD